jgi:hypothetical protein
MKTFSYNTLMASVNDSTVAIPTMTSKTVTDSIFQNVYTTKTIIMRRNPTTGATVQTMNVDIMPSLSDASSGTTEQIVGIKVFFRWTDPVTNVVRTKTIQSARANI